MINKCKRCKKREISTERSINLCSECLEYTKRASKKSIDKTGYISKRRDEGILALSIGNCKGCFTRPIFYEHSKVYCERCFSSRTKANKKYKESNRQLENLRAKSWRERNPNRVLDASRKRRARKINADGAFSSYEWKSLKTNYHNACLWCSRDDVVLTSDHVIPLIRGGSDWITNIQPLCRACNSKKGTKILDFRPFGNAIMEWT